MTVNSLVAEYLWGAAIGQKSLDFVVQNLIKFISKPVRRELLTLYGADGEIPASVDDDQIGPYKFARAIAKRRIPEDYRKVLKDGFDMLLRKLADSSTSSG